MELEFQDDHDADYLLPNKPLKKSTAFLIRSVINCIVIHLLIDSIKIVIIKYVMINGGMTRGLLVKRTIYQE